jgi:hypothetical protein
MTKGAIGYVRVSTDAQRRGATELAERPHSSLDYRTPNEFRKILEGRGAMAPLPSPTSTINLNEKTLVMNG